MKIRYLFSIMTIFVFFGCEKLDDNGVSTETSIDTEITTLVGEGEIITLESKTLGTLVYERINGQNILEGDIILTDNQINTFKNADAEDNNSKSAPGVVVNLWPKSKVNFWIETSNPEMRDEVYEAIQYLEAQTNIDFIERRTGNYIVFVESQFCASYVGMIGGRQEIFIDIEYCKFGTILHEILHALGIFHEQSRPDREQFITIHYDNMRPGPNIRRQFGTRYALNYGPFDLSSIMMYGPCAAAIACGGLPCDDCTADEATITRRNGSLYIRNRSFLTYIDRDILLDTYPKDVRKLSIAALDIGANERGDMSYLKRNGRYIELYKNNRYMRRFRPSSDNSNTSLDITQDGQAIVSGEKFRYGSGRYSRHTIIDISEGGGNIYGVAFNGNSNKLFKKEGNNWIFVRTISGGQDRVRISVDSNGRPWTITNSQINGWVYGQPRVFGKPKGYDINKWSFYDIACADYDEIFVSMKTKKAGSNTLFKFSIRHKILIRQPPAMAGQFDVGGNDGTIWY